MVYERVSKITFDVLMIDIELRKLLVKTGKRR